MESTSSHKRKPKWTVSDTRNFLHMFDFRVRSSKECQLCLKCYGNLSLETLD